MLKCVSTEKRDVSIFTSPTRTHITPTQIKILNPLTARDVKRQPNLNLHAGEVHAAPHARRGGRGVHTNVSRIPAGCRSTGGAAPPGARRRRPRPRASAARSSGTPARSRSPRLRGTVYGAVHISVYIQSANSRLCPSARQKVLQK